MKNTQKITQFRKEIFSAIKIPTEKKRKKRGVFSFLITFVGIFIVLFSVMNFSAYYNIISYHIFGTNSTELEQLIANKSAKNPFAEVQFRTNEELLQDFTIMPPDNRIVIPKINKNVPILDVDAQAYIEQNWDILEKNIQQGLKDGVVHYPHTAKPYQKGNVFLTGHSSYYPWDNGRYKDVFVLLTVMEKGDEFMIYYNNHRYKYQISETIEVDPSEVEHLSQNKGDRKATLMTCVPPGTDLRRLLVIGELKEVI